MIKQSIRYLATENKMYVEGAAASTLAAALNVEMETRGNTVCILISGISDPEIVAEIIKSTGQIEKRKKRGKFREISPQWVVFESHPPHQFTSIFTCASHISAIIFMARKKLICLLV